jgi:hypothetical protein
MFSRVLPAVICCTGVAALRRFQGKAQPMNLLHQRGEGEEMTSLHFFELASNAGFDDGESDASADLSQAKPAKW